MEGFWFLAALVFFILWLAKKPKGQNDIQDTPAQSSYDQGFWDGWRAFGKKVQSDITNKTISQESLQSYVDAGATGIIPGESSDHPSEQSEEEKPTLASWPQVTAHDPQAAIIAIEPVTTAPTAEDKERQALKNLNTMLYVASFLLVAAAAAFIASNTPAGVRLVLLWVITALFYIGGLTLYSHSKRLGPAAISFVGTGLAILPFAGFALTLLAEVPGQTAWFITSLIGIVAYGIATVILQRAVIAYLTLAFVLSLASSSASLMQMPLVWSFVAVMVVALIAHFIAVLWPNRLPAVFTQPIEQTGQYVTPLALAASLLSANLMTIGEYTLIFAVAALQYTVYWAQERTYWNEAIARGLVTITFILLAFTIGEGSPLIITTWVTVIMCMTAAYSLIRVNIHDQRSRDYESAWLSVSIAGLLLTMAGWIDAGMTAVGATITFELILIIAGVTTFRLRQIGWAYLCLGASIILPYTAIASLEPASWHSNIYPWLFIAAALVSLWQLSYRVLSKKAEGVRQFLAVAFCSYAIMATIAAFVAYISPFSLWLAGIGVILATACTIFSYLQKQLAGEAVAIGYAALAIAAVVWNTSDIHTWHSLIIVGVLYLVLLIAGLLHLRRNETERAVWTLGAGQLVAAGFAFGIAQTETRLVSVLLLLAAAVGATARYIVGRTSTQLGHLYAASTIMYLVLAWCGSAYLAAGWQVLVLIVAAIVYWTISYRAAQPGIAAVANMALLGAIITLFVWLKLPTEWLALSVGWVSAGVYAVWYAVSQTLKDVPRAWVHIISLWTILGITSLISLGGQQAVALSASGTIAVLAAFIGLQGYLIRRIDYFDIALYTVLFAILSALYTVWPLAPATVYGHLIALTFIGVALWRRYHHQPRVIHYFLAAGCLTFGAAVSAFNEDTVYQLVFLIEHLIVLIVGGLMQWQKVVWWGVGSTVAAILYFLRDYFFLWLAFLGIVLIAIVVWRLSKINKSAP